jgi:uncharacterized protein (DUF1499 family)
MRLGRWFRWALLLAAALAASLLLAGQLGAFAGRVPTDLGVRDGRLKAPSATPNSVSSQADLWPDHPMREDARIAALPLLPAGAPATMNRLRALVEDMPGAAIVSANRDYLRVQFTTRWMGFVDDAEFWVDPAAGVVQVRSASRLGRRDFGANRARIEALRAQLAAPG